MNWIAWILNIPYTLFGILVGIISVPRKILVIRHNGLPVIIIKVWTLKTILVPRARGVAFASTVLLGPLEFESDLEHELVHTEQFLRWPVVFPLINAYELVMHGYRNNRFEDEAYTRAGNEYRGSLPKR